MVRSSKIMEIIEEDHLVENAAVVGEHLQEQLRKIAEKTDKVLNVRGRGLLTAFDFPNQSMRNAFIKKGLEHHVMFLGCGDQTIRFRPALIIKQQHIDAGIEVIEKILPSL